MRQSPHPVPVRRKPLAGEPVRASFTQSLSNDSGPTSSISLLDQLVEAIEGDIRSAGVSSSSRSAPASAVGSIGADDRVRLDEDAQALAAAGRQAVLRGFDLAASAEALASSGDTTRVVEEAGRKVRDALAGARGAGGMILSLAKAAEDMAGVVDAIASLARQANLLALHATIEAARAGEAGRDFSSVAGRVKSLSEETGNTARDLRARIAGLRDTAGSSLRAVDRIAAAVQETQPALAAAAAAIEERNAALLHVAQHATDLSVTVSGMCSKAADMAALGEAAERAGSAGEGRTGRDDLARPYDERFDPRRRY